MHRRTQLARVLGETAAHRIWRTVVFAGAMLGSAACGGGAKHAEEPAATPVGVGNQADPATAPPPVEPAADDQQQTEAAARAQAIQAARDAGVLGDPKAANPCAANPCAPSADPSANPCAATAANPCASAEPQPKSKKRVRGRKSRPTGRGFILS